MSLKCGIVGLPNAGKSTVFNALTNSNHAETGNYPFCTIDANKAQVFVPDERLKKISQIIKPKQIIPTAFEFTDIAGLVKGASQGEGLGSQFLSHIREVDSLLHVVRAFKDSQVTHVYGEPEPLRDIEIINTELQLSDLDIAEKRFKKIQKTAQSTGDKKLKKEHKILKKVLDVLEGNKNLRDVEWAPDEIVYLKALNFISLKPVLYICNFKEDDFTGTEVAGKLGENSVKDFSGKLSGNSKQVFVGDSARDSSGNSKQDSTRNENSKQLSGENSKQVSNVQKTIQEIKNHLGPKENLIALSCALEAEMQGWTDDEKTEFLQGLGWKEPALHTVIKKVYEQLCLISFFTAGEKEVKAWTTLKGALAPSAAGVIHSDFEKGFIRAEVYSCEELFKYKSEKLLKEKGILRIVGKDYKVQDGDIMHFLFNV